MLNGGARAVPVLFVSPVAERGGAEAVLLAILGGLARERFRPIVAFLRDGPLVAEVAASGVETAVFPAPRARHLGATARAVLGLRRLIRARGVRLVFGNMAMGHLYGGLAALGTAARAVWFQHGVPRRWDPLVWLSAAVPARAVFVPSRPVEAFQASLRPRQRVERIACGVDETRFDRTRYEAERARAELGIPGPAPVVMTVGRLQYGKGQHVFVEAAAPVRERIPSARFVVVGDALFGLEPGYAPALRARAREVGGGAIVFAGFRPDVPALLCAADVLVLPSVFPEGSPVAVLEAMAMEVPVVATSVGGVPELVRDGETGLLVPPGDVAALAAAVVRLLSDRAGAVAMARRARQRILERHTVTSMVDRLERSFMRVLEDA